jgi:hypothetical protein
MGIVIDMSKYKTCRDVSSCTLASSTKSAAEYSTSHLYLMALQARKIIYYPDKNGAWKTSCAFNITQALKTGVYTLKRPDPGLIRLVIHEKPLFYVDMYFRKSFYSSEKMHAMLGSLVDETVARKSWVWPNILLSHGKDISPIPTGSIDWDKVKMKPMDEDLPPRFS